MEVQTKFKIGQAVRVIQEGNVPGWCHDWKDTYVVVAIVIDYRGTGELDFSLATQDEIEHKLGATDGFREALLIAA